MEEVLKLRMPFPEREGDLFHRRLFYSIAVIFCALLLSLYAGYFSAGNRIVTLENYSVRKNVPAAGASLGGIADTAGFLGEIAFEIAVDPLEAVKENRIEIPLEVPEVLEPHVPAADVAVPEATDLDGSCSIAAAEPAAPAVPDIESLPLPDVAEPVLPDEGDSLKENISEPVVEGFLLNASGHVTGFIGGPDMVEDGLLCFPVRGGCTGIEAGALDAVKDEVLEIYIPANITYIAPGAFDSLGNLLYIEVDPDNPAYYSDGGIVYRNDGTEAALPRGRDNWENSAEE